MLQITVDNVTISVRMTELTVRGVKTAVAEELNALPNDIKVSDYESEKLMCDEDLVPKNSTLCVEYVKVCKSALCNVFRC